MTDGTPDSYERKGAWARSVAAVNRWIWRRPNRQARERGWEIDGSGWGGRAYRDPRFDIRKKEILEQETGEKFPAHEEVVDPAPVKKSGSEAFYRRQQKIPRAHDLAAAVGLLWRWRTEIALAVAAPMVAVPIAQLSGPWAALLLAGALPAGAALPVMRRLVHRLVVRHRFQGLCLRTAMRTPEGRMPLVVHTQSIPQGVAMLLWCRSGMSPELFEAHIPEIKVACYAKEVTIYRSQRWAHLLTIELRRA